MRWNDERKQKIELGPNTAFENAVPANTHNGAGNPGYGVGTYNDQSGAANTGSKLFLGGYVPLQNYLYANQGNASMYAPKGNENTQAANAAASSNVMSGQTAGMQGLNAGLAGNLSPGAQHLNPSGTPIFAGPGGLPNGPGNMPQQGSAGPGMAGGVSAPPASQPGAKDPNDKYAGLRTSLYGKGGY